MFNIIINNEDEDEDEDDNIMWMGVYTCIMNFCLLVIE